MTEVSNEINGVVGQESREADLIVLADHSAGRHFPSSVSCEIGYESGRLVYGGNPDGRLLQFVVNNGAYGMRSR